MLLTTEQSLQSFPICLFVVAFGDRVLSFSWPGTHIYTADLAFIIILLSQPPKTWTGFLLFETDLYIVHGWMCQVSLVLHWFYALEICVQGKHVLCRGMGALLKETDLKPLPGYL